ncbi:MAG: hypothetical protein FWG98_13000 [Candidatus Cloacimonetes bacterium]|nr:hypothetical protein [Candidatus Cloacimonadota bacterium]
MKKKTLAEKVEITLRFTFIGLTSLALIAHIIVDIFEPIEWEGFFSLLIALLLFALPTIFSKKTNIKIPVEFQIFFLLFIFAAMYLGEVHDFYYRIKWWDSMLHSTSAILLGYIGFILIFTLNRDKDIHLRLSPFFIALFTFCFALSIGALWEIIEFLVDHLFGLNMQKARNLGLLDGFGDTRLGVLDTMKDLIVDALGALFVAVMGYFYCKKQMKQESTFWKAKDHFIEENPDLFDK